MKKIIRKFIGWFMVLMCISAMFRSILAIVTICTSVEYFEVIQAKDHLPTSIFIMVAFGWIAFCLLCRKTPIDDKSGSAKKIKTIHKVLIYLCEAIIVVLGSFIISGIVMLITNNALMMQIAQYVSIIGIIYFLPSPNKVFNYWQKRKHK